MPVNHQESNEKDDHNLIDEQGVMRFGERLKEALNGESIVSFAKKCGMSDSLIGRYIKGHSYPGIDKLPAIARACGRTTEWLLTGNASAEREDDMSPVLSESELDEWWDIIARSMTRPELIRAIEVFKSGGKQALFSESVLNPDKQKSEVN